MRPVVQGSVRGNGILYTLSILTEKIDYQYKCLKDGWDQNSFTLQQTAFSISDKIENYEMRRISCALGRLMEIEEEAYH